MQATARMAPVVSSTPPARRRLIRDVRRCYPLTVKRTIFNLYAFAALLLGMLVGVFGAYGACVPIWGSQILDTALGSPPDRSHPAFWLSLILLVPSMLLGAAGALALLILPVAFRFPAAAGVAPRQSYQLRFLRSYAERILGYVASHEPQPPSPDQHANDHSRNA